jgi:hypothetical protein
METRQCESLFLGADVGCETVRVFGHHEELAERLERVVTTFRRVKSKRGWNCTFLAW